MPGGAGRQRWAGHGPHPGRARGPVRQGHGGRPAAGAAAAPRPAKRRRSLMAEPVVITGLGVVCALGSSRAAVSAAAQAGTRPFAPERLFDAAAFKVNLAAEAPALEHRSPLRPARRPPHLAHRPAGVVGSGRRLGAGRACRRGPGHRRTVRGRFERRHGAHGGGAPPGRHGARRLLLDLSAVGHRQQPGEPPAPRRAARHLHDRLQLLGSRARHRHAAGARRTARHRPGRRRRVAVPAHPGRLRLPRRARPAGHPSLRCRPRRADPRRGGRLFASRAPPTPRAAAPAPWPSWPATAPRPRPTTWCTCSRRRLGGPRHHAGGARRCRIGGEPRRPRQRPRHRHSAKRRHGGARHRRPGRRPQRRAGLLLQVDARSHPGSGRGPGGGVVGARHGGWLRAAERRRYHTARRARRCRARHRRQRSRPRRGRVELLRLWRQRRGPGAGPARRRGAARGRRPPPGCRPASGAAGGGHQRRRGGLTPWSGERRRGAGQAARGVVAELGSDDPRRLVSNAGPSQRERRRCGCEARDRGDIGHMPSVEQRSRRAAAAAMATGGV